MKVYLGPYVNWVGPYQLAELLKYVGVPEDTYRKFGEFMAESWFGTFLNWIHSKKKRKVKVKIHSYDVWNMDSTLAHIILPMLLMLQKNKHGAPFTQDEDVPENIQSVRDLSDRENEWDTDCYFFARWDYILNEIIFAFKSNADDEDGESQFYEHGERIKGEGIMESIGRIKVDREGLAAYQKRVQNGFRLFGKYYQSLWD